MNQSFENTTISLAQPLPTGFCVQDFLQFHRRDAKSVAERVNGNLLEKGLVWRGRPACLKICFQAQTAQASLLIDGIHENTDSGDFQPLVQRMLGLNQNIETLKRNTANTTINAFNPRKFRFARAGCRQSV